jgi:hypothetical protein
MGKRAPLQRVYRGSKKEYKNHNALRIMMIAMMVTMTLSMVMRATETTYLLSGQLWSDRQDVLAEISREVIQNTGHLAWSIGCF